MTYHITGNTDGSKIAHAIDSESPERGCFFSTHYYNKIFLGDDKKMIALHCFQRREAGKAACIELGIVKQKDREAFYAFAKAHYISHPLQARAIKENSQPACAARIHVERGVTDQVDRCLEVHQIRFKTPTARAIEHAAIIQYT